MDGISTLCIIAFASAADAARNLAGVPAAARAVREAALAGFASCNVVAPGLAALPALLAECARLAPDTEVSFGDPAAALAGPGTPVISGDRIPAAEAIRAAVHGRAGGDFLQLAGNDNGTAAVAALTAGDSAGRLSAAARAVLLGTSKKTDGIVSRHINRPISRAFSRVLLAIPGMRPLHATFGTALLAAVMFASLLRGDNAGLVAGALLFQAASIFDGVDGEIARATFRSSRSGAALDSMVDAVTNLAFLLGVAVNLHLQGSQFYARLGFAGLAILAFGLFLIGRASARSHAPFSFDVVKEHYRSRSGGSEPSRLVQGLTFLTSRDFFALGFALLIVFGMASQALALFAVAAAGWLVAVIFALTPKHA